ncbi:hypothetical protein LI90_928 [Carbonactinospora thermoautotrophica]|uniref:Uncharacterized protein n=1 Tax=Carbonactinospora thermoautotrophica TaxID=1469144 RepID=A0A132MN61_9ACTN|nr:hypothetical protein LI90_928 [Carbonactinospora thermoautotrophica]
MIQPLHAAGQPSMEAVRAVVGRAMVPVWVPWPLPAGWVVTGITDAGERSASWATVVACSGPNPCGGPGDLLLVAEEPGVGLGARYAGMDGPDPGPLPEWTGPHTKITAAGHDTPLWCVPGASDRAVFVGEAMGLWLWAVLWPASAGCLMYDEINLIDLREAGPVAEMLPFGALSPRISG